MTAPVTTADRRLPSRLLRHLSYKRGGEFAATISKAPRMSLDESDVAEYYLFDNRNESIDM